MAVSTAIATCPSCGRRNRVPAAARGHPRCSVCHADLPWLVDAGDDDFTEVVERSALPVLVDVWAPWCRPCRMVAPVVEQLATERAGRMKVAKVNADLAPATSARHRITGIPALLVYANGREIGRTVGALPPEQLRQWVDATVSAAPSARP